MFDKVNKQALEEARNWNKNLHRNLRERDKILGQVKIFLDILEKEKEKIFEGYENFGFGNPSYLDKELDLITENNRLVIENKFLKERLRLLEEPNLS